MYELRNVIINGRQRVLHGLPADPYLRGIGDHFEQDYCSFCAKVLKPDAICWDIGANIGFTSIVAADYCSDGKVYAFDGGSELNKIHRKNLADNGIENVEVIDALVGERKGSARFTENSAYGYVSATGQSEVAMLVPADIVALTGREPDYVKIDVEGYEPCIIKSGLELFKRKGTVVHFELNSIMLVQQHQQPLDFLEFIIANFECVFFRPPGTGLMRHVSEMNGANEWIWQNMAKTSFQFVDDVVVTSDPSRLPAAWT